MVEINLSEDQENKIRNGQEISIEIPEFSNSLSVKLQQDGVDVEVVENVNSNSNNGRSDRPVSNKSIPDLKSELVETKTQRKKLESEASDIEEKVEYFNEKIRLAKKEDRDDLVDKARSKKSDKMDRLQDINDTVNELKRREHNIKDKIESIRS